MYFVNMVENETLVEVLDYQFNVFKTYLTMTVINPATKRKLVLASTTYDALTPEEKDQTTWREMTAEDIVWAEDHYYSKLHEGYKEKLKKLVLKNEEK